MVNRAHLTCFIWLTCGLFGCTRYGDAVLSAFDAGPKPDSGSDSGSDEKPDGGSPFRPPLTFDRETLFRLNLNQVRVFIKDLLVLPSGYAFVLLEQDCTIVGVTPQGTLDTGFGKQGIYSLKECRGRKLAHDPTTQRLLVAGVFPEVGILFALSYQGAPPSEFGNGTYVKLGAVDVTALQHSSFGILVGGSQASGAANDEDEFFIALLDKDGNQLSRSAGDAGDRDRVLAFLQVADALDVVGSFTNPNNDEATLFRAGLTVKAQIDLSGIMKMPVPSPYVLQVPPNRVHTDANAVSFILASSALVDQPAAVAASIFAFDSKGQPKAGFGDAGMRRLADVQSASWNDLALTPAGLAVVGEQKFEGTLRSLLTLLDVRTGEILPRFAREGFVPVQPAGLQPVLASVEGTGNLVVAGTAGLDGAEVFVGRLNQAALLSK